MVLIESILFVSSVNAGYTSNSELVRDSGIVLPGSWPLVPIESSSRYLAPSRVFSLIWAVLASPMKAPLILKTTLTLLPSSVGRRDGADLHTGDAYVVGRAQVRVFGEVRGVRRATADERKRRGVEGRPQQGHDQNETDRTDRGGVARAERLAADVTRRVFIGPCSSSVVSSCAPLLAPRLRRALRRDVDDLAAGELERATDVTEVEVEP